MTIPRLFNLRVPLAFVAALAFAACTEDTSTAPPPPTLDATFAGYSNPDTRQTTCGNCHVEKQADWVQTKHASAWANMQASGHASSTCYPCHTTSGISNPSPDNTGYFGVDSAAGRYYFDVQCEACHGAGAAHIAGPESTQPIGMIAALDSNLAYPDSTYGCGTCHSGSHNPFVEEWASSGHGSVMAGEYRSPCWNCHESKYALQVFSPGTRTVERATDTLPVATCAVCHDPHGSPNGAQLRRPIDQFDVQNNLCMTCHNNRAAPATGSSRGNQGHGVQGQVLLGTAGWIPPGFTYDTTQRATHGNPTANPRSCAGCHVNAWSVTSGGVTTYSTGHTFDPTPCVDASGIPTGVGIGGCPVAERSFRACAVAGCHGSESSARGALVAESTLVQSLVNTLWVDVDKDKVIDAFPADSGLLPKVKQLVPTGTTSCNPSDTTISVCDGAEFNVRMFAPTLADHPDGSRGAHNPYYYESLLITTINFVRSTYGLPAPPAERTTFTERMRVLGMTR